jgi:hypothetical protein
MRRSQEEERRDERGKDEVEVRVRRGFDARAAPDASRAATSTDPGFSTAGFFVRSTDPGFLVWSLCDCPN